MPSSRTNVTAIEQNSETQNLIPNAMKRDNDTGEYTINHLESGRIIIIFAQQKVFFGILMIELKYKNNFL